MLVHEPRGTCNFTNSNLGKIGHFWVGHSIFDRLCMYMRERIHLFITCLLLRIDSTFTIGDMNKIGAEKFSINQNWPILGDFRGTLVTS